MCMERGRFSQTMASEWQTAFVVSHKLPWCALHTAVKNCNKSLEKLQDFFFTTETKTKTKCSRPRPRPRLHDPRPRPRPRLSFLSSRRLESKTLVSRTTSLIFIVSHESWIWCLWKSLAQKNYPDHKWNDETRGHNRYQFPTGSDRCNMAWACDTDEGRQTDQECTPVECNREKIKSDWRCNIGDLSVTNL